MNLLFPSLLLLFSVVVADTDPPIDYPDSKFFNAKAFEDAVDIVRNSGLTLDERRNYFRDIFEGTGTDTVQPAPFPDAKEVIAKAVEDTVGLIRDAAQLSPEERRKYFRNILEGTGSDTEPTIAFPSAKEFIAKAFEEAGVLVRDAAQLIEEIADPDEEPERNDAKPVPQVSSDAGPLYTNAYEPVGYRIVPVADDYLIKPAPVLVNVGEALIQPLIRDSEKQTDDAKTLLTSQDIEAKIQEIEAAVNAEKEFFTQGEMRELPSNENGDVTPKPEDVASQLADSSEDDDDDDSSPEDDEDKEDERGSKVGIGKGGRGGRRRCPGPKCVRKCTGRNCPCKGRNCIKKCTGPKCPCKSRNCIKKCTGPKCPCRGPNCIKKCTGPKCPCRGPNCIKKCTGPKCPCRGPNCIKKCTGPKCPCQGPNCIKKCTGPNCPCKGPNCPNFPVTQKPPIKCRRGRCPPGPTGDATTKTPPVITTTGRSLLDSFLDGAKKFVNKTAAVIKAVGKVFRKPGETNTEFARRYVGKFGNMAVTFVTQCLNTRMNGVDQENTLHCIQSLLTSSDEQIARGYPGGGYTDTGAEMGTGVGTAPVNESWQAGDTTEETTPEPYGEGPDSSDGGDNTDETDTGGDTGSNDEQPGGDDQTGDNEETGGDDQTGNEDQTDDQGGEEQGEDDGQQDGYNDDSTTESTGDNGEDAAGDQDENTEEDSEKKFG